MIRLNGVNTSQRKPTAALVTADDVRKPTNDAIINKDAGFGTSIDKTTQTFWVANGLNQNYELQAKMYQYWLPRRIVDLIPNEGCRKGWEHVIPSWTPEQIQDLQRKDLDFKVKDKFKLAWKWERLFGGGLVVYMFDQSEGLYNEPLNIKTIKKGSLINIDVYDPWQAYAANIDHLNFVDDNYRKPSTYTLGTPGFMMVNKGGIPEEKRGFESINGAIIHHTRVNRFNGLELPWYDFQNNWYWGQSLIASVHEALANADLVTQSTAQLLFKLSVPVMKVPDIKEIITDDIAKGAFLQRMNLLNTSMSNNHMAIIDAAEELTNLEQSGIAGIDPIIERFYTLVSAACGIPVTKLVGESAKGLNATGEGDEKNFFNAVEAEREDRLRPRLEEFYDMFFPAMYGIPRPTDHKIVFPALYQETPEQKAATQTSIVNNLSLMLQDGVITKKIYIEEIVEKEIVQNISEEDKLELLGESEMDEEDLDDALDLGGSSTGDSQENPYKED